MANEEFRVSLYRYEKGQLKAFADLTFTTPFGEVTIRGFRVMQKTGNRPWVGFPESTYQKNGTTQSKPLIDVTHTTERRIQDAILAEFLMIDAVDSELPDRPQRG